jgi:hypothetical protein
MDWISEADMNLTFGSEAEEAGNCYRKELEEAAGVLSA